MRAKDFEQRRIRLRLTKKRLAELAGIDESCLGRYLNERSAALTSTVEKIDRALSAEERRLRADLSEAAA